MIIHKKESKIMIVGKYVNLINNGKMKENDKEMFAYDCRICQLKLWEEILLIVTQQCQAGVCKPLTSESIWAVAAQD